MIPTTYVQSRDKIVASKTQAELSEAISFSVQHSNEFSIAQQKMLQDLIKNKENELRVSKEYAEVDKENFKPLEIEVSSSDTVETVTKPLPATPEVVNHIEETTPKKIRKPKAEVVETPQITNTYRVKRRVNRPIDGVQYSNNEYEVEVESTDQATLLSELDAIEKEVTQRLSLYNRDALEAYGEKKFKEGVASVKPVQVATVNTFQYDMSQVALVNEQYAVARYQRLNAFVLQAFEKFPDVKAFYSEFDRVNPKVPAPNL